MRLVVGTVGNELPLSNGLSRGLTCWSDAMSGCADDASVVAVGAVASAVSATVGEVNGVGSGLSDASTTLVGAMVAVTTGSLAITVSTVSGSVVVITVALNGCVVVMGALITAVMVGATLALIMLDRVVAVVVVRAVVKPPVIVTVETAGRDNDNVDDGVDDGIDNDTVEVSVAVRVVEISCSRFVTVNGESGDTCAAERGDSAWAGVKFRTAFAAAVGVRPLHSAKSNDSSAPAISIMFFNG